MSSGFRSLKGFNFRVWLGGAAVSNIGTWMQRIGQDWLVLTILTHNNATAVGIVTALQFGPQILLIPLTGYVADHFDRRRVVLVTQALLATLALTLGVLTIAGWVALWHVYILAACLGCVTAFDVPARQAFVSELVGEEDLSSAVGLNAAFFNSARLIGPALAGFLIAAAGPGWAFVVNGLSFSTVLIALCFLRVSELHRVERPPSTGAGKGFIDGFRYVRRRPELRLFLFMLFLVGAFGMNFPIYISTMAVKVFHLDAGRFGVLTSAMAIGAVAGAFMSARRAAPSLRILIGSALVFGAGCALAAAMPTYWLFGLCLAVVGAAAQTFTTSTNALVQMSTEPAMRGRVIAIVIALTMGGSAIGGPIVGFIADHAGPRWALAVATAAGFAAAGAGVAFIYLAARRRQAVNADPDLTARSGV